MADHVLPEPWSAAVEREAEIVKTVSTDQFRERVDAEELDVTAIVQRWEVHVHFACRREHEIFKVAVIRRA